MEGLREVPIHSALYRPTQLMGCDRTMVIVTMGASALIFFSCMDIFGAVSSVILALLSVWALRRMAKADPMMRQVYLRQVKYAGYYHPFSRPFRNSNKDERGY